MINPLPKLSNPRMSNPRKLARSVRHRKWSAHTCKTVSQLIHFDSPLHLYNGPLVIVFVRILELLLPAVEQLLCPIAVIRAHVGRVRAGAPQPVPTTSAVIVPTLGCLCRNPVRCVHIRAFTERAQVDFPTRLADVVLLKPTSLINPASPIVRRTEAALRILMMPKPKPLVPQRLCVVPQNVEVLQASWTLLGVVRDDLPLAILQVRPGPKE